MNVLDEFIYRRNKHGNGADLIVLMAVGDFYETYDNDAKECASVLGLTMNKRKNGDLTGFPKYRLKECVNRLCKAGYTVVVVDENNDYPEAKFTADGDGIIFTGQKKSLNENNNNQKTEKAMEKKFATLNQSKVYWFNREREALVCLKIVRENFTLDTGKTKFEWAEADDEKQTVILVTSYDPQEPDKMPAFYDSPEDFERGEAIKSSLYYMAEEQAICRVLLKGQHNQCVMNDEQGAYVWAFIKGQAVKWYFNKHIDVVTWHYENGAMNGRATADADVPESYYSAKSVYQWNDWVEVTENGERIIHEAMQRRMFLEPDQEKLAEKLQAVINECKEAGMCIYWSNADYTLNAVNLRKVERLEYDPEVDEETEQAFEFDDSRSSYMFSNVTDLNTECDEVKFVVKK